MEKLTNIAVIAPSNPAQFFDLIWKGVSNAACELAASGVRIQSYRTDGLDVAAQSRILRDLEDADLSAICLFPAHGSLLDADIARHAEIGRPVITFNTDAPASRRTTFVGTDAGQAGALAGELLVKMMGARGTVASFPGSLETNILSRRYAGFLEELARSGPEMREFECHRGFEGMQEAARKALAGRDDIGGIFVGCSRVYLISEVLESLNLRIPCVGFDNTSGARPYLLRGTVSALIDDGASQQGYIAVQQGFEAALAAQSARTSWVRLRSSVLLASHCQETQGESVDHGFELLVRQRTSTLRSYQKMLEEANTRLQLMAETDALTGLLNRRKFDQILDAQAECCGELSLLIIDLDGFKAINDRFGHPVGDEALKAAARVLQVCTRNRDYCARMGGDEFCVLLPGASRRIASEVRDRIVAALSKTVIAPQTLNLGIHASIGIASMPGDAATVEDLIIHADSAMYTQKRLQDSRSAVA